MQFNIFDIRTFYMLCAITHVLNNVEEHLTAGICGINTACIQSSEVHHCY
jgi:hypothetical protein